MSTHHSVIISPAITEKNTSLKINQNKYVFEVDTKATKPSIKRAVEQLFEVKVESVNTVRVKGKLKRQGKYSGYRPDWKKAIVKVQKGQTISKFEGI